VQIEDMDVFKLAHEMTLKNMVTFFDAEKYGLSQMRSNASVCKNLMKVIVLGRTSTSISSASQKVPAEK
jgi:hypothetical protein